MFQERFNEITDAAARMMVGARREKQRQDEEEARQVQEDTRMRSPEVERAGSEASDNDKAEAEQEGSDEGEDEVPGSDEQSEHSDRSEEQDEDKGDDNDDDDDDVVEVVTESSTRKRRRGDSQVSRSVHPGSGGPDHSYRLRLRRSQLRRGAQSCARAALRRAWIASRGRRRRRASVVPGCARSVRRGCRR